MYTPKFGTLSHDFLCISQRFLNGFDVPIKNNFLFNFSASYLGGGYKRLREYAKWFNANGGARFIIHPNCMDLIDEYKNNFFYIASLSQIQRIFNDCSYLENIKKEIGNPDLYYSYGIPIYSKLGKINWFHLSNVLPLGWQGIPLCFQDIPRLAYLGWKIRRNYKNADVISAESRQSLELIGAMQSEKLFLSVNGSDDELGYLHNKDMVVKDNIAIVVGTINYKALQDSYYVFEMLRKRNHQLKLVIIGDEKTIPRVLRRDPNVIITGFLKRNDVIDFLKKSIYYISTTYIENSYNAASEGIFFADESYISDIGPHKELLDGMFYEIISIPKIDRKILYVKRGEISELNLKNWADVIKEMITKVNIDLSRY